MRKTISDLSPLVADLDDDLDNSRVTQYRLKKKKSQPRNSLEIQVLARNPRFIFSYCKM